MYISKKALLLLQLLLDMDKPITNHSMADSLEISSRSVRTYMREVAKVIEKCGGLLVNKPGVGSHIEADLETRERLYQELEYNLVGVCDPKQRRNYMLYILLQNNSSYTIQQFSDELLVSRNVTVQDLKLVEEWLGRFELSLQKKPGIGLTIQGKEMNLRQAMAFFHRHYTLFFITPAKSDLFPIPPNQIEQNVCMRLSTYYPKVPLRHLFDGMMRIEKYLKFQWTIEAKGVLLSQLCVLHQRIKAGVVLRDESLWKFIPERTLWLAGKLRNYLNEGQALRIPADEIGYLAVCIMAAEQQLIYDADELSEQDMEWKGLAEDILTMIGEIIEYPLNNDEQLVINMASALNSILVRLQYNIWTPNPLLEDIKKRYTSLFGACWTANLLIERQIGLQMNENEVGNICLLISGSISRSRKQRIVRTAIVCGSGIGVSQYLASVIEEQIPNIHVEKILPYSKIKQQIPKSEIDLVLSCGIKVDHESAIQIHVPPKEADFEIITQTVNQILRERVHLIQPTISSSVDFVLLDSNARQKKDVIAEGCALLQQKGYVAEEFEAAVLKREAIHETDIGNGIAIPHALGSGKEILKPAIAILRLQKPILWGSETEDTVDLVFILALQYVDNLEIQGFFKQFYFLLRNEDVLREIRRVDSIEKIKEIFDKKISEREK